MRRWTEYRGAADRLLCLGLFLVLSLAAAGCGKKTDGSWEPQDAVVWIKAGDTAGSAVVWESTRDGGIVLLTAAHVLDGLSPGSLPTVCFADGAQLTCERFACLEQTDAALLYLTDRRQAKRLLQAGAFAHMDKERFDSLGEGHGCLAIGCSETGEWTAVSGEILDSWIYMEDYSQYMLWAQVQLKPGMSGGGLFDAEGYFLGILSGGSGDGQAAVVPLSLILSRIQDLSD